MITLNSPQIRKINTLTILIFSALVIIILLSYWKVQQDDAYIGYTYAKNLANGNGYVFNKGEKVNAITSPFYVLTTAVIYSVLRSFPLLTIPIVAHLLGALSLWMISFLSMKLFKDSGLQIMAFIFPVLFLANPLLKNAAGMETPLSLMFIMLSFYLYQKKYFAWLAVACGLAVLSRPAALILPALLMVDYILTKRKFPPIRYFLIFLLTLTPWLIFSYLNFKSFLPWSLSVKLGQTQTGRWGTGLIFLKGLCSSAWPYGGFTKLPLSLGLTIATIYLIACNRKWRQYRIMILILIWNLSYLFSYGIILNPPAYPWYYTPLSIGITLILTLFFEMIGRSKLIKNQSDLANYIIFLLIIITALALVVPLKTFRGKITAKYENYKLTVQWLNKHAFKGASVAANEIGILGYFYEQGKIIDALGLISPPVAAHVRQQDYTWYVHEYQPDFLIFNHPHRPILEKMVNEKWFQKQYQTEKIINIGRRATAVYKKINSYP